MKGALNNGLNRAVVWRFLSFQQLSTPELYAVLQLRSEIFVVEQNCVFQDMDGSDDQAMHLLGEQAGQLLAYARCFDAGVKFAEASIGRVVTHCSTRGTGMGHALMTTAIAHLAQQWGAQPIRIGAQAHLAPFYRQHGFVEVGEGYLEDGIPHVEMLRSA